MKKDLFSKMQPEVKSNINQIVNKFVKLFDPETLMQEARIQIRKAYVLGIDNAEEQFDMNFMVNQERLNFLQQYVFNNIKDLTTDMGNDLRQELSRGILNLEHPSELKDRIKKILNVGEVRARAIARTESSRAENMGNIDGARQSGLPLYKEVIGYLDKVTSPICKALIGVKIPIDDKFEYVDQKGNSYEWDVPPFHVNCFLKDTLISTKKGKKKIQDIKIGDSVLTHKNRYKKVYHTMINESEEYYEIEVGFKKNKRKLKVTGGHPILTQRGWVAVEDLTIKDHVLRLGR